MKSMFFTPDDGQKRSTTDHKKRRTQSRPAIPSSSSKGNLSQAEINSFSELVAELAVLFTCLRNFHISRNYRAIVAKQTGFKDTVSRCKRIQEQAEEFLLSGWNFPKKLNLLARELMQHYCKLQMKLNYYIGHAHLLLEQFEQATLFFTDAIKFSDVTENTVFHALLHVSLGDCYAGRKEYVASCSELLTALKKLQLINDKSQEKEIQHHIASCYLRLGKINSEIPDYAASNAYLELAQRGFVNCGDPDQLVESQYWRALNCVKRRQYKEAVPMLTRAYEHYAESPENRAKDEEVAFHLGLCCKHAKQYPEAISWLEKAMTSYGVLLHNEMTKPEDKEAIGREYINASFGLGLCYMLTGDGRSADRVFSPVLSFLQRSQNDKTQAQNLQKICGIMSVWLNGQESLLYNSVLWPEIAKIYNQFNHQINMPSLDDKANEECYRRGFGSSR